MTYIVTGGAGLIGSVVVHKLNAVGIKEVIVVDNLGSSDKWKNLIGKSFVDYIHKDKFLSMVESGSVPSSVKAIIHMGACSSTTERNIEYLMHNNTYYTRVLAEYCLRQNIRFIYASSAATYGAGELGFDDDHALIQKLRPLNGYGFSKNAFDQIAYDNSWLGQIAGLRFFNVYGPNEYHKDQMRSVVHKAWQQVKANGSIKLFKSDNPAVKHGDQSRDFIYVKDCAEVVWSLLQKPKANGVFNLGTGRARTWNDLARAVFKALGKEPNIEYIEMPQSLVGQYQNFTEAKMKKLQDAGCMNQYTSLEDGVRDYVQNFLEKPIQYL